MTPTTTTTTTSIITTTTPTTARTKTGIRWGALLFGLLTPTVIAMSASAQIAGSSTSADPKTATKTAQASSKRASAKAAASTSAAATPAPTLVASADPLPAAQPASAAPGGGQSVATTLVTVTPQSTAAPVSTVAACLPDCRAGYVCREGECVSACNPMCGENETCNAKRECVPKTEANESYPYDKTRFSIGGSFGMSATPDGNGTPFGGVVGVGIPLGGHWYSREDVVVTYSQTSTDDHQYIGGAVSTGTVPVDQSYLLIALRATAGYQFNSLLSARAGVMAGSHTLTTQHGFCGAGYAERDSSSAAVGGTAAIAFAIKHADLSAVVDAYSAETQQLCTVTTTTSIFGNQQAAQLIPQRQVAAQFLAQLSFLF